MTFLTDTNVLSEGTKPRPDHKVLEWLADNEQNIVVDPIVLGEIRFGILRLPQGRRREQLERWFEEGVRKIVCLPWEAATGIRWANLLADLRRAGQSMPVKDSMIAATALRYGLIVVTRNGRDFQKAGLVAVNPFE